MKFLTKKQVRELTTLSFAETRQVPMRDAAFAIGIERVARASKMRGYV